MAQPQEIAIGFVGLSWVRKLVPCPAWSGFSIQGCGAAIIELELPLLSGLDLIWRLVKRKQPKPLKIIATTSTGVLNGPLLENVVKELGVDAVVRKPIPPQNWRKTVEAVLAGQRPNMAA
jgi:DNA-binding response OmpR family regulator